MDEDNPSTLKIGILLESYTQPAWIHHVLKSIVESGHVEVTALLLQNPLEDSRASKIRRIGSKSIKLIGSLFFAVDKAIFVREKDALARKDVTALITGSDKLSVDPTSRDTIELRSGLRERNLDIVLNFVKPDLNSRFSSMARYGCWSISPFECEAHPAGFWEVIKNNPFTYIKVIMSPPGSSQSKTLHISNYITHPMSPARNRNTVLWASSVLLLRQIHLLHRLGASQYFAMINKRQMSVDEPFGLSLESQEMPMNLLAKTFWYYFLRLLKGTFMRVFYRQTWQLSFSFDPDALNNLSEFIQIEPTKGKFWADPNVVENNGTYQIFFEEFSFIKNRGYISVINLDKHGKTGKAYKVLEKPYHLSYPFVFKYQQQYYMVPESANNRTIDLYECEDFPCKWRHKMTLMDGVIAMDSTLLFYKQKWWLFTGLVENEGTFPQVELFVFYSTELLSQNWHPHVLNPVVSDVTKARPAGQIFIKDQILFRPSQNYGQTYGNGFDLNRIHQLSESEYVEERVLSIRPGWDREVEAMHTYSVAGDLTVIDIMKRKNVLGLLAARK